MELVYLYIKEFKNLTDEQFNFSRDYLFNYELESNKLTYQEKEDALGGDFFGGKICNVTGVLGKNGSGKTNLMEAILYTLEKARLTTSIETFAICRFPDGSLVKFGTIEILHKGIKTYEEHLDDPPETPADQKSTHKVIYYSPVYDGLNITLNSAKYFNDISTNRYLREAKDENVYEAEDLIRILDFLSTDFNLIDDDFQHPNSIDIMVSPLIMEERKGSEPVSSIYEELLVDLFEDVEKNENSIENRIKTLTYEVIKTYQSSNKDLTKTSNDNVRTIKQYLETRELKYLRLLVIEIVSTAMFQKEKYQKASVLEELAKLDTISEKTEIRSGTSDLNDLKVLIRLIASFNLKRYPFQYKWFYGDKPARISTGERMFLSLFGRLFGTVEESDKDRLTTIILDEPDVGLHPQWQKKLIKYLLDYINSKHCKYKRVQLIITSHSPFIASDLPTENVIYIGEPNIRKPKTFAANIHNLFADSFFIKDGFIGDFARSKLEKVITHLKSARQKESKNEQELTTEQVYQIINLVGEPTVREKLLEEYVELYDSKNQDLISYYQRKIDELSKRDTR